MFSIKLHRKLNVHLFKFKRAFVHHDKYYCVAWPLQTNFYFWVQRPDGEENGPLFRVCQWVKLEQTAP